LSLGEKPKLEAGDGKATNKGQGNKYTQASGIKAGMAGCIKC
jgi:hypothetical protein